MDIVSHTLTGVAVGTVFATISNFSWKKKILIVLSGALGGALPDLDAISLWSKFDSTIGRLFSLNHTGKEIYFEKFWYSHHAAFHSILAPIILILISTFSYSIKREKSIKEYLNTRIFFLLAFFFGFIFHLLEDMPTPASVWGGINLFYPSSNYSGGFGKIWWWNNYDLVLIIASVIVLNLLINVIPKHYHKIKMRASILVFALGVSLFIFQINTRPIDFSYTGHTPNYNRFESQSKLIQKEILGDKLFQIMVSIDNKIPLNF